MTTEEPVLGRVSPKASDEGPSLAPDELDILVIFCTKMPRARVHTVQYFFMPKLPTYRYVFLHVSATTYSP
jgi:hypothetical protein